jgi:fumarylpyruvate hydrolase
MIKYAVEPMDLPTVPVADTDGVFPVRRIYCVGRNYAEHAREMGSDPDRDPPFFFMKPNNTIIPDNAEFPYPSKSENVHYEMELVVAIEKGGRDIPKDKANDHIFGYACGLDMTRRDLQIGMREKGRPWEIGKAFDASAPCAEIQPAGKIGHPKSGAIWLKVNGETKQSADIADLIWNVPETIEYLSGLFTLQQGDLIYTGTPAGVGPIIAGDLIEGHIDGVGDITIRVA